MSLAHLAIGAGAGVVCAPAVGLKYKLGFDDSLDVVGVHLVGGLFGTLMVGLVATAKRPRPFPVCSTAAASTSCGDRPWVRSRFCVYSAIGTAILALIVKYTIGLRLDREGEAAGIDEAEHAETGYDFAGRHQFSSVLGRHSAEV